MPHSIRGSVQLLDLVEEAQIVGQLTFNITQEQRLKLGALQRTARVLEASLIELDEMIALFNSNGRGHCPLWLTLILSEYRYQRMKLLGALRGRTAEDTKGVDLCRLLFVCCLRSGETLASLQAWKAVWAAGSCLCRLFFSSVARMLKTASKIACCQAPGLKDFSSL
eukprot:scaffold149837_cov20-Tisochrysis_lutea.AAC.1